MVRPAALGEAESRPPLGGIERGEARLDALLRELRPAAPLAPQAPLRAGSGLLAGVALALFEDQLRSRCIDRAARELRAAGRGFYTIQSAGHEQNGLLGLLLRRDDPCLLHYRSGALMLARARAASANGAAGVGAMLRDILLSICASRDDPVSQGRHKVWGSRELWVPPQTSTIASHLPKATGLAFALLRATQSGVSTLPDDAIVCCSFGDASVNHATALTGIHAARFARRRGSPVPILFVCEDNGIGLSVETPRRWIEQSFGALPQLDYVRAEGDLATLHDTIAAAIARVRETRGPLFLHLPCVRLYGHAGSDVETAYRTAEEIRRTELRDPLLENARLLVESGAVEPAELSVRVERVRAEVAREARRAGEAPHLASRAEVVAPLAPYDEERCRAAVAGWAPLREAPPPRAPSQRTLAAALRATLAAELARRPELQLFGEDVGRKGGVYHVTAGLQAEFGVERVFDTLLDETTVLGLAQGAALAGLLPIAEIQYLAYLHNALDQLRGEACSQSFFSSGQFPCGLLVRVASFAYQKGFGGHFHNDNSIAALRDIPGLVVCAPARAADAASLLRGCISLAAECGRVVAFLEPIALYHEKDLHTPGDEGWLAPVNGRGGDPSSLLLPGEVGVYRETSDDLLLVSYANGLRMSLRVAARLERDHGIRARVLDLRWLSPLPLEAVLRHARGCRRTLIVDECRASGGVADALIAVLAEDGEGPARHALRSVRSADCYVPLGPAAATVLLQEEQIEAAALALCAAKP